MATTQTPEAASAQAQDVPPTAPSLSSQDADGRKISKPKLSIQPTAWFGAYELPPAVQSQSYAWLHKGEQQRISVTDGKPPYSFSIDTSSSLFDSTRRLPPGMTLSNEGVLSGSPTQAGAYRFTVEVEDSAGAIGTADFLITVRLNLQKYAAYFDAPTDQATPNKTPDICAIDLPAADGEGTSKLPLSLCEFLAYKSAQAYLQNDPNRPKTYLKRILELAHPNGEIQHFAFFDSNLPLRRYTPDQLANREDAPLDKAPEHWPDTNLGPLNRRRKQLDAQGFGFVFEGRTFIICRGTTSIRDWRVDIDNGMTTDAPQQRSWMGDMTYRIGLRSKRVNMTEEERFLIAGPDQSAQSTYLTPARSVGFAAAWAAIRDPVENWLETVPGAAKQEFVFSGHSLGGAMAFVGAQEFAEKHQRKIHAVATFGAPCVGKPYESPDAPSFIDNYKQLQNGELEQRTIRLETSSDAVPKLMLFKNFQHVGRAWEVEFPPLPSASTLILRRFVTGPLLWMARAGVGGKTEALGEIPRKALGYALFYGVPFLNQALAAHGAYDRYALFLSTVAYRKIRAAEIGDLDGEDSPDEAQLAPKYQKANQKLDQHLSLIYAPKKLRAASPRLMDLRSEKSFRKRYYGRTRAKYLF
ncbi:MAG: putative Ig domain-containing protein [Rhodobacteraceae bacterium]|nr:putative Ig domain-containing protein [Paracoccaceae bacterium]